MPINPPIHLVRRPHFKVIEQRESEWKTSQEVFTVGALSAPNRCMPNKKTDDGPDFIWRPGVQSMHIRSISTNKTSSANDKQIVEQIGPRYVREPECLPLQVGTRFYFTLRFEQHKRYFNSHSRLKECVDCSVLYYGQRVNEQKLPLFEGTADWICLPIII